MRSRRALSEAPPARSRHHATASTGLSALQQSHTTRRCRLFPVPWSTAKPIVQAKGHITPSRGVSGPGVSSWATMAQIRTKAEHAEALESDDPQVRAAASAAEALWCNEWLTFEVECKVVTTFNQISVVITDVDVKV